MIRRKRALFCAAVATASCALAAPAAGQFYKGKTLTAIINYAAGGNTDIQGRSVLRFMGTHIPGRPRIVVKNMPGAGGVVATNYLGEAAKRDGTVMGVFTVAIMADLMKDPALRVSHRALGMVGAIGQQTITHVRRDVKPGVTGPRDFLKVTQTIKSAGHAPNSSKDLRLRLMLDMLGIKYEHVTGYKSAGTIRRAILQNEIQLTSDSLTGYVAAVVPSLIKPGISVPLWHLGLAAGDGTLRRSPTVDKSIPTFLDVYRMKYGENALPKGIEWDAILLMARTRQFLRILCLPPGVPKEALAALRTAWEATAKDKAYLADYRKLNKSDMEWLTGEEAEREINAMLDVKPEMRAFLLKLAGLKG